jgi:elongation factor 1-gamma
MSGLTLYTDKGNFRAFKILIAAEYNNVDIAFTPDFKIGVDTKTEEFKKLSPTGKVPVLNTPQGALSESNAIARYIARYQRDSELYGCSFFESGQVDSWIDFCSHDLELPVSMWIYPVFGYMPYNAAVTDKAKGDVARALQVLENHLSDKTYLVGQKITLADITLVSALVYPFKFVADADFRAPFPNVMRWFDTCVNQVHFQSVIGQVVLCASELTTGGEAIVTPTSTAGGSKKDKKDKKKGGQLDPKDYPKKEKSEKKAKAPKAPQEKKVKEEKEEEVEAPKPKKEDHLFKVMDKESPSTFVMDTWKKTYSNCETYEAAMTEFWSTFDAAGWSIHRGDYMYDEDNSVPFMTSNLIAGFIQRTEEIRKWLFGTMTIRGVAGKGTMPITAYYLIRGQSMEPLIQCNDDAAFYKWTKMDIPASDADKAMLFEYWTADTTLEGQPCLDSRCYK